ncbi:MAG: type I methionyl aminopeptidase [Candidatus Marinimicrobia bacterium]|nr:type I methionyl aminopeptidase [Candidatus Neomarinimicrobiota bacterium]
MIFIKNRHEIKMMRRAGRLAARLLDYIAPFVKEGVSTQYLNDLCETYTRKHGARSAPLHYNGFPKSICTSINDVVCHGIPSEADILKSGDIVNIDVTVNLEGYHGDTSGIFLIGNVLPEVRKLVERTEKALMIGIRTVRPGGYFSDIGLAIERYISRFDYAIVKEYGGHGIGKQFHEEPMVYHHYTLENRIKFKKGMIFTIEPMIIMGGNDAVFVSTEDNWTVRTADGSPSAQFEHTVLVTSEGAEILTRIQEEEV